MEDPLYREIILEHWQNPQNYGSVKNPSFDLSDNNPSCGDKIRITGKIKNGKLIDVRFTCQGCAVSKASASILTGQVKGMLITEIIKLKEEDILKNLGVEITPARYNCALLCLRTFQNGLK